MKKVLVFLCILMVLVGTSWEVHATLTLGVSGGDATVYESFEEQYWYPDLGDFVSLTYSQQLTAIAGLNVAQYAGYDDWHLASPAEMEVLWGYDTADVAAPFDASVYVSPADYWIGRYEEAFIGGEDGISPMHYYGRFSYNNITTVYSRVALGTAGVLDTDPSNNIGAWIVSDGTLSASVPEPATMLLLGSGLIGLVGFRRKKLFKE